MDMRSVKIVEIHPFERGLFMNIRKKTQKRQLTCEQKLSAVNEVRLKIRHRQEVADELGIRLEK